MVKALIDLQLKECIDKKYLVAQNDLYKCVQPASIDLPLSDTAYLVKEKILPFEKRISEVIKSVTLEKISLKKGALFLKGQTYLVPCISVELPTQYYASLSPKSSIGRIDVMVRGIFDGIGLYDTIPVGGKGNVWLEITPQSFNILVKEGLTLSQMMIFDTSREAYLDFAKEQILYSLSGQPIRPTLYKDKIVLSVDLVGEIVGYEAKVTNDVLDLSQVSMYSPQTFFKELETTERGKITLEKDKFYILATKEKIAVPTSHSAEMIPFSHLVGELRAHYAGFFDPGWGYGREGEVKGTIAVLEVRPHETITIFDGQPICLMEYFVNTQVPQSPYGFSGNHYHTQKGPQLAKYFKK
jgi:dCTP deaminase